jgi:hypothetical protein
MMALPPCTATMRCICMRRRDGTLQTLDALMAGEHSTANPYYTNGSALFNDSKWWATIPMGGWGGRVGWGGAGGGGWSDLIKPAPHGVRASHAEGPARPPAQPARSKLVVRAACVALLLNSALPRPRMCPDPTYPQLPTHRPHDPWRHPARPQRAPAPPTGSLTCLTEESWELGRPTRCPARTLSWPASAPSWSP